MQSGSSGFFPHIRSYQDFWEGKGAFPEIFKEFMEVIGRSEVRKKLVSYSISNVRTYLREREDLTEEICQQTGESYTQGLYAEFANSQGENEVFLGFIPRITERGTFIINGKERAIVAQLAPSPGLFFEYREFLDRRGREKCVYVARFRPAKRLFRKQNFWIEFHISDGQLEAVLGRRKKVLPVTLLRSLGFETSEIEEIFLEHPGILATLRAFEANKEKSRDSFLLSSANICSQLGIKEYAQRGEPDYRGEIKEVKVALLTNNYISPVGRWQIDRKLGRLNGHEPKPGIYHVTKDDIRFGIKYLLAMAKGDSAFPADDLECISNKRIRLIGNLIQDNLESALLKVLKELEKWAFWVEDSSVSPDDFVRELRAAFTNNKRFEKSLLRFFTLSDFSRLVPRNNALAALALARRIDLTGPGGVDTVSANSIPARDIHWSHRGRLCPIDTSQNEKIGLALSLTEEARINKYGQILAPFRAVKAKGKNYKIAKEDKYLSAADEEQLALEDREDKWIAYGDQASVNWEKSLVEGSEAKKQILARSCCKELEYVRKKEIGYVESPQLRGLSLAALLVPFSEHNDANRIMMACNAMRQALPLKDPELPCVRTGLEREIISRLGNDYGNSVDGCMTFGKNLLVAYLPWKGFNFEDAIVISARLQDEDLLTSLHTLPTIDIKLDEEVTRDTLEAPEVIAKLDERGVVKVGEFVAGGDVLVGKIRPRPSGSGLSPIDKIIETIFGSKSLYLDVSAKVPYGVRGRIAKVTVLSREHGDKLPEDTSQRYIIQIERQIQVGDKLANRHGGKGVISEILPEEQMPYFLDPQKGHSHDGKPPHTHVDVIINPLSVISRLNPGQLYETHLGYLHYKRSYSYEFDPFYSRAIRFDPAGGADKICFEDARTFLRAELGQAGTGTSGKAELFDPQNEEKPLGNVVVGYQYFMKLDHLADDKERARASGHNYDLMANQPIQTLRLDDGTCLEGGQRLGEMEVEALEAHRAYALLQELLTLKSDNPKERRKLQDVISGDTPGRYPVPVVPEATKTILYFIRGLGLDTKAEIADKEVSILDSGMKLFTDELRSIRFQIADANKIEQWSSGVVSQEKNFGHKTTAFSSAGLLSSVIYTDPNMPGQETKPNFSRSRMGHIELESKVINPLFFGVAAELIGISIEALISILQGRADVPFRMNEQADGFIMTFTRASRDFATALAAKLSRISEEVKVEELQSLDQQGFVKLLSRCRLHEKRAPVNQALRSLSGVNVICDVLRYHTSEYMNSQIDKTQKWLDEIVSTGTGVSQKDRLERKLSALQIMAVNRWCGSDILLQKVPVIPVPYRCPYDLYTDVDIFQPPDLHRLYENLLRKNHNLKECKDIIEQKITPSPIRENESKRLPFLKRELQFAVEALFLNCYGSPPLRAGTDYSLREGISQSFHAQRVQKGRKLKSLADHLQGKLGLFVRRALGKRVDYSGRAVIIPDPEGLKLDECGLPLRLAVKLFTPILLGNCAEEQKDSLLNKIESVKRGTCVHRDELRTILNELLDKREYPVLLNRQPTLHRLGIQAFWPKLTDNACIALHPLVTKGFGADFDGDAMAVYLPLTPEARAEAKKLIRKTSVLSPADGDIALNLSQDIALGVYWLAYFGDRTELEKILGAIEITPGTDLKADLNKRLTEIYLTDKSWKAKFQQLKSLAFQSATDSGLSIGILDFPEFLAEVSDFKQAAELVDQRLTALETIHPVKIVLDSKARGDIGAFTRLMLMKGESSRLSGGNRVLIRGCHLKGFSSGELFASCYGARATQVDKSLNTGRTGGLYKRLVEASRGIFIETEDCSKDATQKPLGIPFTGESKQLIGRNLICESDEALRVQTSKEVLIRSPITCRLNFGVCRKCYGYDPQPKISSSSARLWDL